ncbi:MAG: hypothetical protein AB9903_26510 [Vulcanimicrobiota bacterium]
MKVSYPAFPLVECQKEKLEQVSASIVRIVPYLQWALNRNTKAAADLLRRHGATE